MGAKIENGHLVVTTLSKDGAAELESRMKSIVQIVAHCSASNFKGEGIHYLMGILEDMLPNEHQISKYLVEH